MTPGDRRVIFASSLGTVFEWYDFYLYGSLASIIGAQFFSQFPQTARDIFALLAFAAGFLVRPFGALVFGRLGDLVGRKYTFLVTILIMGLATFLVGLLPSSKSIGVIAPLILLSLRLLQGLALGGEYGGAATYVAEHAPHGRRGFYTSWIQTTATLGLFLSLIIILAVRGLLRERAFADWGWRIPFLLSSVLLGVSLFIRLRLSESPAFLRMRREGGVSQRPLTESFGRWSNAKIALLALVGLTIGQGVVWYTGQFYALFFLQSILHVDGATSNLLVAWSLALGAPGFILFGWLSDRVGRKPIILAGCLLAALTYFPIFHGLTALGNPALARAIESVRVTVVANPADCGALFNPVGTRAFTSSCDRARDMLARSSVKYSVALDPNARSTIVKLDDGEVDFDARNAQNSARDLLSALEAAGYPRADNREIVRMSGPFDIFRGQTAGIVLLLLALVFYVTMVYGPIAAALVELFPTRIRYSSMSLPYHIGNGWFGGLLPATAFAMVAQTGDIYFGLWYPILFALVTVVVGALLLPETKDRDIYSDDLRRY